MPLITTLHPYHFDTRKPEDRDAWLDLHAKLSESHPRCMESCGDKLHYVIAHEIMAANLNNEVELFTLHLFENQWNAVPVNSDIDPKNCYRLFDWALDARPLNLAHIKQGYWLDQTEDMVSLREYTCHCRYCGAQYPVTEGSTPDHTPLYCNKCLGSPYLKESELYLTRLVSVSSLRNAPQFLTPQQQAIRVKAYQEAQLRANADRTVKLRADLVTERDKAVKCAETKLAGMTWLMDRGISTENVIYYTHTDRFNFGWKRPLSAGTASALRDLLAEFPFTYDLKTEEGKE